MAKPATYFAGGTGTGVPVRVVVRQPDDITTFGGARVWSETIIADMLTADVPGLAVGDTITIGAQTYTINGEPVRDAERVIWTAELVPA